MKILFTANDTNFAWNLRREVMMELVKTGHTVTLAAKIKDFECEFREAGVRLIDIDIDRRGTNPFSDVLLFCRYRAVLKKTRPDIVFTNNIKPNIYAGLACQLLKIRYISNITGLGTSVENPGPLQRLSVFLYRLGVRKATAVFFQNSENQAFFYKHRMIKKDTKEILLPGSGVNLESFPLLPWPSEGPIHILFAARIMKEKGIDFFLAAARRFASEGKIVFDICGQCDDPSYLQIIRDNRFVTYHGLQKDLRSFYEQCSLFLYPSYYPEGMSNVLLEASASGRPVITTDRAGCRETVDDKKTGFIIPVKNEQAVLDAVGKFLSMSPEEMKKMGTAGREKMIREFDRTKVVKVYCEEVEKLSAVSMQR